MTINDVRSKVKDWRNRRGGLALSVLLLVIAVGYAIFFTSKYYMPKVYKAEEEINDYGDVLDMGEYTLTLLDWKYSESENKFDIVLEPSYIALARQPQFKFTCRHGEDVWKTTYEESYYGSYMIVHVTGVPSRWTTATLKLEENGHVARLVMDDRRVETVERLGERTEKQWKKDAALNYMQAIVRQQLALYDEIDVIAAESTANYEQIEQLMDQKATQTERQRKKTDEAIRVLADRQEQLQGEIDELQKQIYDLNEPYEDAVGLWMLMGGEWPYPGLPSGVDTVDTMRG